MSTPSGPEGLPDPVNRLVDAYYDQLWQQGYEAMAFNPAVWLGGIASGDVVWREGENLKGYAVNTFSYSGLFAVDSAGRACLGFSEEMQKEGVWVLRNVRIQRNGPKYERVQDTSNVAWAHYNGENWHVARRYPDRTYQDRSYDDFVSLWEVPSTELNSREKESIARVARDADLILDVAASLADRMLDHRAFKQALAARAQASEDAQQIQGIDAQLKPWEHALPYYCGYSTLYQLPTLASALYRALVGREQSDAGAIKMIRDLTGTPGLIIDPTQPIPIKEATICPPYEPVDLSPNSAM